MIKVPQGHHAANTADVKRYIDFASANGGKGVGIMTATASDIKSIKLYR